MAVPDPVAFTIGPLAVRWYGILIALGVVAGTSLAAWVARRKGENADHIWDLVPFVLVGAVVGARAYWVWLAWPVCCAREPLQALNVRGGGLSIHGAIAGGLLTLWLFARVRRLPFLRWADIIVPGLALGQAIGRWGNFANQEAFGGPTSLPWGIPIWPENRPPGYEQFTHFHPTFLYESLYDLAAAALLTRLALRIDRDRRLRDGDVLWVYLIMYAVARFAIETLRTDSLLLGPFKAAQVASLVILLVGVAGLVVRHLARRGDGASADSPAAVAAGWPREEDPAEGRPVGATAEQAVGKPASD